MSGGFKPAAKRQFEQRRLFCRYPKVGIVVLAKLQRAARMVARPFEVGVGLMGPAVRITLLASLRARESGD